VRLAIASELTSAPVYAIKLKHIVVKPKPAIRK